jgi:DNA-binding IclR family transcriptional regulator
MPETGLSPSRPGRWTFLTGHAHALIVIAREPDVRIREIAVTLGVTERTAQAIVNDLVEAGYLERTRVGNRSHYEVNHALPFRHAVERDHAVGELLGVLAPPLRRRASADAHSSRA